MIDKSDEERTVRISEDLYYALVEKKRPGEGFPELVHRLLKRSTNRFLFRDLTSDELVGIFVFLILGLGIGVAIGYIIGIFMSIA